MGEITPPPPLLYTITYAEVIRQRIPPCCTHSLRDIHINEKTNY